MPQSLIRIAIFYDGGFFSKVSDHYRYHHPIRRRLNIRALHEFVRQQVSQFENADINRCRVVDVHYFRGRFPAEEAAAADRLLGERKFEDVLIREGIVIHYFPIMTDARDQSPKEKGIDVWLSLEAYELAVLKRFDVCVLVAGDTDYVPLVRKLNTLGTRVMVLGWDVEHIDENGERHPTRTSVALLGEVSYPILVSELIGDSEEQAAATNLFL